MLIGLGSISSSVNSRHYCHCMFDIFKLIIENIRVKYVRLKLGRIYSQAMNKENMGCQYDCLEIHINLQGGELAFKPRHGFWL